MELTQGLLAGLLVSAGLQIAVANACGSAESRSEADAHQNAKKSGLRFSKNAPIADVIVNVFLLVEC